MLVKITQQWSKPVFKNVSNIIVLKYQRNNRTDQYRINIVDALAVHLITITISVLNRKQYNLWQVLLEILEKVKSEIPYITATLTNSINIDFNRHKKAKSKSNIHQWKINLIEIVLIIPTIRILIVLYTSIDTINRDLCCKFDIHLYGETRCCYNTFFSHFRELHLPFSIKLALITLLYRYTLFLLSFTVHSIDLVIYVYINTKFKLIVKLILRWNQSIFPHYVNKIWKLFIYSKNKKK